MDIREIDMHLRDTRALEWIKARAMTKTGEYRPVQFPQEDLADYLGCHINTARNIVLRLVGAGYIGIESTQKAGGYVYGIVESAKAA